MTNEQAKSELMQIYGMLSEEKKQALDVLMAQNCDQCEVGNPCLYCKHEFKAQADGEYIKKSDMIDWLKDIRHKMKPQNYHTASEFEIAENQIWNLIQMLQMGAFPTVAIPSAEPKTQMVDKSNFDIEQYKMDLQCAYDCGKASVEPKTEQFAKWVATEIFDEWEYNKDTFAEIACRKLAKLGIVRAKGDEWELVEQEPSGEEWEDGYKRAWAEAEVVFEKEPKTKTGHWIYDRTRDWDGECKYECSECGMGSDVDYDYCMRCGAKMVEPQESEEV